MCAEGAAVVGRVRLPRVSSCDVVSFALCYTGLCSQREGRGKAHVVLGRPQSTGGGVYAIKSGVLSPA